MRNRDRGNRYSAINALLSELVKPERKAAPPKAVLPAKLAGFMQATSDLRVPGKVPEVTGKWLVVESPHKWGDPGVQDRVQEVKALGFKSCFVKGNRLGVRLTDLAAEAA